MNCSGIAALLLRPWLPDGIALESVAMTKSKDTTPNDRCFFMPASSAASVIVTDIMSASRCRH
jgi:hypothetical protein